ncbi:DUF4239 domain-containing protein [Beijerinckia indica]|uniref:DUF4239 domain-containing protein n=1 Tax=Beijerinckia indica subsp. indica (strain ATCC 9039 / DSM 1715 / NCIMB 8712) TaxID=395963 RepID=B2ICF9_BEII9|nr:DUF4239 domain-containing protein [Beijerinckia indica]ACB93848.1 hypothetical protein Bind_0192 [Beijerinckia indica subsp. indica ATCC 9039]
MGSLGSLLVIGIVISLSICVTLLVHHHIEIGLRRRYHDVGATMFLQLGVIFAVLLAFVFSEVWSEYNEAAHALWAESDALRSMGVLAVTLPREEAGTILKAQRNYVESVIETEWPRLAGHRRGDKATAEKLDTLTQQIAAMRLSEPDLNDTKRRVAALLAQAQIERDKRIFEASYGVPLPLWVLLIIFSGLLSLFASFSQIEDRLMAVAMSACFTFGVASILVLVRLLDYPFEGALSLPPDEFRPVLERLTTLLKSIEVTPQQGADQ